MDNSPLESTLIPQPELWRLAMLLQPDALHVAILPPVESEQAIYRRFMLDSEAGTLKALEDVIYANPLLLSDFRRIDCITDMPGTLMVPMEVAPADYETLMERAFDEEADYTAITASPTGTDNAVALTVLDSALRAFLTRTFFNIRFDSSTALLCRHLASMHSDSASPEQTMLIALRQGRVDITAMNGRSLITANSLPVNDPADAAFYIVATVKEFDIEPSARIIMGGDMEMCRTVREIIEPDGITPAELHLPPMRFRASAATLGMPVQLTLHSLT